ncbi:unnamed protein product [Polarella glacialis]|uniref:Uncharacterized protein n=1 Tax=Polarella glacialis TaxID=89957 RepID=A0A813KF93_POLGL|nr:unnamed protein product [Polarella glacialis]
MFQELMFGRGRDRSCDRNLRSFDAGNKRFGALRPCCCKPLSLFVTKPSSPKALDKTDIYDMVTAALKDHALTNLAEIKLPAMLSLMGDLGDDVKCRSADLKMLDVDWFIATKEKLHTVLGHIDELYIMIGKKINAFNAISKTCQKICPNHPRIYSDKDATCKDKLKIDEENYSLLKKAEKALASAVVLHGVRSFELAAMYEKCTLDYSGCKVRSGMSNLLHKVKKYSQDLIAMAASQQEKMATYQVSKDGMHPTSRRSAECKNEFDKLMSPSEKCDYKAIEGRAGMSEGFFDGMHTHSRSCTFLSTQCGGSSYPAFYLESKPEGSCIRKIKMAKSKWYMTGGGGDCVGSCVFVSEKKNVRLSVELFE